MTSQLLAALFGAAVAFSGTYLLQRGQFRRRDLEGLRERLGLARGLRADLYTAKLVCESSLKNECIPPGTEFPVYLWRSDGHRIIGAVVDPAETALIDAFARMGITNGLLGALRQSVELNSDGDALKQRALDSLQLMIEKIELAVSFLNKLESEYEEREPQLQHPFRERLPGQRRKVKLNSKI